VHDGVDAVVERSHDRPALVGERLRSRGEEAHHAGRLPARR
jgi:hypothetical protein